MNRQTEKHDSENFCYSMALFFHRGFQRKKQNSPGCKNIEERISVADPGIKK